MKKKDIVAFFCMAGYIVAVFTGLKAYAASEYTASDLHIEDISQPYVEVEDKNAYKLLAISDETCTDICTESIFSSVIPQ